MVRLMSVLVALISVVGRQYIVRRLIVVRLSRSVGLLHGRRRVQQLLVRYHSLIMINEFILYQLGIPFGTMQAEFLQGLFAVLFGWVIMQAVPSLLIIMLMHERALIRVDDLCLRFQLCCRVFF